MHGTAECSRNGAKKTGKTDRRQTADGRADGPQTDRRQTKRTKRGRKTASDRPGGRKGEDAAINRRSWGYRREECSKRGCPTRFLFRKRCIRIRCVARVLLPPRCILPRCGTWGPDNEWACRNPVPRRGARCGKSVYGTVYSDNIS